MFRKVASLFNISNLVFVLRDLVDEKGNAIRYLVVEFYKNVNKQKKITLHYGFYSHRSIVISSARTSGIQVLLCSKKVHSKYMRWSDKQTVP